MKKYKKWILVIMFFSLNGIVGAQITQPISSQRFRVDQFTDEVLKAGGYKESFLLSKEFNLKVNGEPVFMWHEAIGRTRFLKKSDSVYHVYATKILGSFKSNYTPIDPPNEKLVLVQGSDTVPSSVPFNVEDLDVYGLEVVYNRAEGTVTYKYIEISNRQLSQEDSILFEQVLFNLKTKVSSILASDEVNNQLISLAAVAFLYGSNLFGQNFYERLNDLKKSNLDLFCLPSFGNSIRGLEMVARVKTTFKKHR